MVTTTPQFSTDSLNQELALADRVRICINRMGYPQLGSVACRAEGDRILLSGQLDSFYMKQVAQVVAAKTPGVRLVQNDIEVA